MAKPDTNMESETGEAVNRQLELGRQTIRTEAAGLQALEKGLGAEFAKAVQLVLEAEKYLILVGVGKSGHVGQKLAASFASTGTPAFFVHPTEASHGDLGMIIPGSVVLGISASGESSEMRDVLNYCDRNQVPVIGITRNPGSTLGRHSRVVLQLPETPEACPNGLAPTTSTTASLALGDALMIPVMNERGFSRMDFGKHHPGGKLGMQLQSVREWLNQRNQGIPGISFKSTMKDIVMAVSEGRNGCVAVLDEGGAMMGMITDGDLRRAMDDDFFNKKPMDIMTRSPISLQEDMLISEAIEIFTGNRLSSAFVLRDGIPVGVMQLKTLLEEGYL